MSMQPMFGAPFGSGFGSENAPADGCDDRSMNLLETERTRLLHENTHLWAIYNSLLSEVSHLQDANQILEASIQSVTQEEKQVYRGQQAQCQWKQQQPQEQQQQHLQSQQHLQAQEQQQQYLRQQQGQHRHEKVLKHQDRDQQHVHPPECIHVVQEQQHRFQLWQQQQKQQQQQEHQHQQPALTLSKQRAQQQHQRHQQQHNVQYKERHLQMQQRRALQCEFQHQHKLACHVHEGSQLRNLTQGDTGSKCESSTSADSGPEYHQAADRKCISQLPAGTTTLLIHNIPVRYSQKKLLEVWCQDASFELLFLPFHFGKKHSIGYAYSHFVSPDAAAAFYQKYHGSKVLDATKGLRITPCKVQGLAPLLRYLVEVCNIHKITNSKYLPAVFDGPTVLDLSTFMDRFAGQELEGTAERAAQVVKEAV